MADMFEAKTITPMLIGREQPPFDSADHFFELKLDGERGLAYLDKSGVELRNKRNMRMLPKYPELAGIHKQVKERCILDGEYIVLRDGKPDFDEIKRRSIMTNPFKIDLAVRQLPVSFVAYDILYWKDKAVTDKPLTERKELLKKAVPSESPALSLSRTFENTGIQLFELTKQQGLEGIVAKQKNSRYYPDKRTTDWIKCKNLQDDDFVVCGYIFKEGNVVSIVLGQYRDNALIYKGHVTLGISREDFSVISGHPKLEASPFRETPKGNENAEWVKPDLVCTVKFMSRYENGYLRHAVFKGLRNDKDAKLCVDKK